MKVFADHLILKTALFLVVFVTGPGSMKGQTVTREWVLVEMGTSTDCAYCPSAALGAEALLDSGCRVALVANHERDDFENEGAAARNAFNKLIAFTTAKFDGVFGVVGGNPDSSIYWDYFPRYESRIVKPTTISLTAGITRTGTICDAVIRIKKEPGFSAQDPALYCIITQSNIPYPWLGQAELHHVNRSMVPDKNGVSLEFGSLDSLSFSFSFTLDQDWPAPDCEFIAFVQDRTTRECYQVLKKNLGLCYPSGMTEGFPPLTVAVSPNPTRREFTLTHPFQGSRMLTVSLTNLAGETVYLREFGAAETALNTRIDPGILPQGLYLVTVSADARSETTLVLLTGN